MVLQLNIVINILFGIFDFLKKKGGKVKNGEKKLYIFHKIFSRREIFGLGKKNATYLRVNFSASFYLISF